MDNQNNIFKRKKETKQKLTNLLFLNLRIRFYVRLKLQTLAHIGQHKPMYLVIISVAIKLITKNVR
jgi:hypothetical protein